MKFTKMNGAGNDFIIVNNIEEKLPLEGFANLARTLCQRRMSIGADGFMVVDKPTEGGDYKMIFYNSDGSLGEMCGNGARCIARYGYEMKLAGETQKIETTAGMVLGHRIDKRQYKVKLNNPTAIKRNIDVEVESGTYKCSYVELGDPYIPHATMYYPNLAEADEDKLLQLGRQIRFYEGFPKGANVNFYDILCDGSFLEKTYERGVEDFTLACGTGTGSVGLILTLEGKTDGNNIHVRVPGGDLYIDVEINQENEGNIEGLYLTGPTNMVAMGEVLDEEL